MKKSVKQILIDMAYTNDAKPRFINEKWVGLTDNRNLRYIDEATEKILKLIEKTPEDIAYEILCCDDEYSIPEMITAIEDQYKIDGGLFIDYVDGVSVWEKMELEFTCEEFLTYIGKIS